MQLPPLADHVVPPQHPATSGCSRGECEAFLPDWTRGAHGPLSLVPCPLIGAHPPRDGACRRHAARECQSGRVRKSSRIRSSSGASRVINQMVRASGITRGTVSQESAEERPPAHSGMMYHGRSSGVRKGAIYVATGSRVGSGSCHDGELRVAGRWCSCGGVSEIQIQGRRRVDTSGPALGFCEIETFASNITFTADLYGDSGRFIKKANWVDLFWYQGANTGGFFNGTYKRTPVSEYKGTFSIGTETFGPSWSREPRLAVSPTAGPSSPRASWSLR